MTSTLRVTTGEDVDAVEVSLIRSVGALVGGEDLAKALGYPSQNAFRNALARGRIPICVFMIQGRRGRFALAHDIAAWLCEQRDLAASNTTRCNHAREVPTA